MSVSKHSVILKNDGTLWGCGYNSQGQLGLGDNIDRTTFTQITTNVDNIKSVYCGGYYTFILKNDGTLWACGRNESGQLGLGDTDNRYTFTQITTNTDNIKSIHCGCDHAFILKNDGTLWGCGWNRFSQLGLGDTTNRYTFTQITTNTDNIQSVYCSNHYNFILKNDGTLWTCGWNKYGQLGLGDTENRTTFVQIITNIDNFKSIYYGSYHTLILKNNNTLWGCGRNDSGQLGLGDESNRTTLTQITTNTDNVKSIHCGNECTTILKNDGTLWGCGNNQYGQLGLGDINNRKTFTIIGMNSGNIRKIYCGQYHMLILKNDGTLWGYGDNSKGQLGLGSISSESVLTQITTNTDDIKCFANDYNFPIIIKIYDSKIGCTETLDTNNFRNIPVDKFEKIKVLNTNPVDTYLNCLISFDKKQTWKTFDGLSWNIISDVSPQNIISNGMELIKVSQLNRNKLIAGGFIGDLDFKIAMKTNDKTVTSSVTKIYIEYK